MKKVKLYEVREFVGNDYSRPLGRRLRARAVALRLVKRLKKQGREVFAAPVSVNCPCNTLAGFHGLKEVAMHAGMLISIFLGGALAPTAVFVEMVHATVAATTDKAVLVQTQAGSVWIPKKALVLRPGGQAYSLARWFRPTGYQQRVLERAATVSGVSAAP